MKNIRLGLVRADTHGYYYAVMLNEMELLLLQKHDYVVHHYATNIFDPQRLTGPRVPGFDIVKVYDYNSEKAQRLAETLKSKPRVCKTLDEMTKDIDAVFIADCDGGGQDHLKLATPFLTKGIPTFVDKPFASTAEDARQIVRLAEKYKAPLFNASILSYVPAAAQFRNRFEEISGAYWPVPQQGRPGIGLGVVKGVGGAFSQELFGKPLGDKLEDRMAYLIHGLALALNLFGAEVEYVEAMGTQPLEYVHLHLADGRETVILNTSIDIFPEECNFYASAYSKYGVIHSGPIGDPQFLGGAEIILRMFQEMVRTGQPPVPYQQLVHPIAVIDACVLSQKEKRRVSLPSVNPASS